MTWLPNRFPLAVKPDSELFYAKIGQPIIMCSSVFSNDLASK